MRRGVLEHQHDAVDPAAGILDRCATVFDGNTRAVAADQQRVVREPDDYAFTQHVRDRAFHRGAGVFRNDPENFVEAPGPGLRGRPAGQLLCNVIEVLHAAVLIRGDDGVADTLQQRGKPLLAASNAGVCARIEKDDQQHERSREQSGAAVREQRGRPRARYRIEPLL